MHEYGGLQSKPFKNFEKKRLLSWITKRFEL